MPAMNPTIPEPLLPAAGGSAAVMPRQSPGAGEGSFARALQRLTVADDPAQPATEAKGAAQQGADSPNTVSAPAVAETEEGKEPDTLPAAAGGESDTASQSSLDPQAKAVAASPLPVDRESARLAAASAKPASQAGRQGVATSGVQDTPASPDAIDEATKATAMPVAATSAVGRLPSQVSQGKPLNDTNSQGKERGMATLTVATAPLTEPVAVSAAGASQARQKVDDADAAALDESHDEVELWLQQASTLTPKTPDVEEQHGDMAAKGGQGVAAKAAGEEQAETDHVGSLASAAASVTAEGKGADAEGAVTVQGRADPVGPDTRANAAVVARQTTPANEAETREPLAKAIAHDDRGASEVAEGDGDVIDGDISGGDKETLPAKPVMSAKTEGGGLGREPAMVAVNSNNGNDTVFGVTAESGGADAIRPNNGSAVTAASASQPEARSLASARALDLASGTTPGKIAEQVQMLMTQDKQQLELRLHPSELGHLHIKLQLHQDQAQVSFVVQNHQAREALEQALPRLREMLSEAGIQLGQSSVEQQPRQQHPEGNGGQQGGRASGYPGGVATDPAQEESRLTADDRRQAAFAVAGRVDYFA